MGWDGMGCTQMQNHCCRREHFVPSNIKINELKWSYIKIGNIFIYFSSHKNSFSHHLRGGGGGVN